MRVRAAVWGLAIIVAASAGSAWAISLSDLQLDYLETFAGETALPTTLEINNRGLGPLFASSQGNGGLPGLAQVVNQRVHFGMTGVDGVQPSQSQVIAIDGHRLGSHTKVAAKATFDALAFTNTAPALEAVSVGLGFDGAGKVTAPDVIIGASLSRIQLPPDLWALEIDLSKADGTFTNLYLAALPSAIQSAISAGGSFELTLRYERATRQARASLVAAGQELLSSQVAVPDTAALPIVTVSTAAQVLNADPGGSPLGGNDSMQVDLRRFEVYAASLPSVPALVPWSTALLAAALLLLAMTRRHARGS